MERGREYWYMHPGYILLDEDGNQVGAVAPRAWPISEKEAEMIMNERAGMKTARAEKREGE